MHPEPTPPTRVCRACLKAKSPSDFWKKKTGRDGLMARCKICEQIAHRQSVAKHLSARRSYAAAWRAAHREEARQTSAAWRMEDDERYRESRKRWVAANRSVVRDQHKRFYANHRDEINAKHRAYYYEHPESYALRRAQRRQREVSGGAMPSTSQLKGQLARQKGRCYWCRTLFVRTPHLDHVVPLSRGGSNVIDNLVYACAMCNLSRRARLPHEWPQGGRLL